MTKIARECNYWCGGEIVDEAPRIPDTSGMMDWVHREWTRDLPGSARLTASEIFQGVVIWSLAIAFVIGFVKSDTKMHDWPTRFPFRMRDRSLSFVVLARGIALVLVIIFVGFLYYVVSGLLGQEWR